MKHTLNVRLRGALLLGGGGDRSNTKATLRDASGEPYIPASALKGAIREQLQRLCGRETADVILGREGHAARLDGGSTGVYLSDAAPAQAAVREAARRGAGYAVRTQVAIDRRTRRVAGERLFAREVFAPPAEVVFQAEADTSHLGDDQRRCFQAAVRAVFALGAGRSGGLGAVDMWLDTPASNAQPEPPEVPDGSDLVLELEAVDPLCLGAGRYAGNLHRSLDAIPASTLRGAIVSAAMRQRQVDTDRSADPAFQRLVLEPDTCLRFADAVPVGDGITTLPRRAPYSLRVCKREECGESVDTLAQNWLVRALADAGRFAPASDACPQCGQRTTTQAGWLGAADPLGRVVTRVALDAATARAAEGQLFSLELIERGTVFLARVGNVDDEGRRLLEDAASAGLRVGRGRGQGYGRVRVRAVRAHTEDLVERRVAVLDARLRAAVEAWPLDGGSRPASAGTFLVVTLQSDLVAPGSRRSTEVAMCEALGLGPVEILAAQVRAGQRGGYDTKAACARGGDAPKSLVPVVAAGSTLLLRLDRPLDGELVRDLERLERHGAGLRRDEGMGWVRFSDELHRPGWRA